MGGFSSKIDRIRDAKHKSIKIFCAVLLLSIYIFTRHANNFLVEEQHLLFMASGLLELEMKRRDDLLAKAQDAVTQHSSLEGRIQKHLIDLNGMQNPPGNNRIRLEKMNELLELLSEYDSLKEKYPDLKSKDPYIILMDDMKASGLRVMNAKLAYNRKVNEFNTYLKVFPYKLVARPLGFVPHPFQEGGGEKFLRNNTFSTERPN
jgi:LemA protein